MHVAITTSRRTNKAGVEVTYHSALIRRTYRQDGKAKQEGFRTAFNAQAPPTARMDLIDQHIRNHRK